MSFAASIVAYAIVNGSMQRVNKDKLSGVILHRVNLRICGSIYMISHGNQLGLCMNKEYHVLAVGPIRCHCPVQSVQCDKFPLIITGLQISTPEAPVHTYIYKCSYSCL